MLQQVVVEMLGRLCCRGAGAAGVQAVEFVLQAVGHEPEKSVLLHLLCLHEYGNMLILILLQQLPIQPQNPSLALLANISLILIKLNTAYLQPPQPATPLNTLHNMQLIFILHTEKQKTLTIVDLEHITALFVIGKHYRFLDFVARVQDGARNWGWGWRGGGF